MMSLVNALVITLLFAYWVWTLKQDIEGLRQEAHAAPVPHPAPHGPHGPPAQHAQQQPHPVRDPHDHDQASKARGHDGVPTWTIE